MHALNCKDQFKQSFGFWAYPAVLDGADKTASAVGMVGFFVALVFLGPRVQSLVSPSPKVVLQFKRYIRLTRHYSNIAGEIKTAMRLYVVNSVEERLLLLFL